jgi:hypothetical protein
MIDTCRSLPRRIYNIIRLDTKGLCPLTPLTKIKTSDNDFVCLHT